MEEEISLDNNKISMFFEICYSFDHYFFVCLVETFYLQVMRIADRGADIVRITVQGRKEADACFEIKNSLVQKK